MVHQKEERNIRNARHPLKTKIGSDPEDQGAKHRIGRQHDRLIMQITEHHDSDVDLSAFQFTHYIEFHAWPRLELATKKGHAQSRP
jgi:hypothetical protein